MKKAVMGALCIGLLSSGSLAQDANWGYDGDTGPQNWYRLPGNNALCRTGQFQSPINIEGTEAAVMHQLNTHYTVAPVNLAHTSMGIVGDYVGDSRLEIGTRTYLLNGFVFRNPAEHTVAGETYPLSIQFMHTAADGSRAIVVSLVKEGRKNLALSEVTPHLPLERGQRNNRPDVLFNARDLMPNDKSYYRYNGSLTIPPCTEGVAWYILKTPIEMSVDQIQLIQGVLGSNNARPMQSRGNRIIMDAKGQ